MNALLPPLSLPFLLLAAVALWAPVMLTALQRRRLLQWWTDLPVAALAGALAALAAVLLLPPGPAVAVFGLAAAAWAWSRGKAGRSLWPVLVFVTALLAVQIIAMVTPGGGDAAGLGTTALVVYLALGVLAWALDRKRA